MKAHFRQSMAWLHTWCGLVCGWLLCAIFLTGTLSVFRDEITRWMEAEPVVVAQASSTGPAAAEQLAMGTAYLAAQAADARFWRIELPKREGAPLNVFWRIGTTNQQAALDPQTGQVADIPAARKTTGGGHFVKFHYSLQADVPGFYVVGVLSAGMLIALISGVVIHKKIFIDFFTFRWGKGQRSWLDAHNATAVLTLPFLFMIVYTGLAIFYTSYVPMPMETVYGNDGKAFSRFEADVASHAPAHGIAPLGALSLRDLSRPLAVAETALGRPIGRVLIDRPASPDPKVRFFGAKTDTGDSPRLLNAEGSITFSAAKGAVTAFDASDPMPFSIHDIHRATEYLHRVAFGGAVMQWLYFLSGLAGTAMMITGSLLFSAKRRLKHDHAFGAATPYLYRAIESLNVALIAGSAIASIAYFYGNRLIPADVIGRAPMEIRVFFWVWLATLVHAVLRPPQRAWVEQAAAGAVLCAGLPLLNAITTGQHLGVYAAAGDWARAGVEITSLGFAMLLAAIAYRAARAPVAVKRKAPAVRPASAQAASS